jgi:hypothetical protein
MELCIQEWNTLSGVALYPMFSPHSSFSGGQHFSLLFSFLAEYATSSLLPGACRSG